MAMLDEQRVARRIRIENPNRAVATPSLECGRFVRALPVWPLHFEHHPGVVRQPRGHDERHVGVFEWSTQAQGPGLRTRSDDPGHGLKPRTSRINAPQPLQPRGDSRRHACNRPAIARGFRG